MCVYKGHPISNKLVIVSQCTPKLNKKTHTQNYYCLLQPDSSLRQSARCARELCANLRVLIAFFWCSREVYCTNYQNCLVQPEAVCTDKSCPRFHNRCRHPLWRQAHPPARGERQARQVPKLQGNRAYTQMNKNRLLTIMLSCCQALQRLWLHQHKTSIHNLMYLFPAIENFILRHLFL